MKPHKRPTRAWSLKIDKDLEPMVKIDAAKDGEKLAEWVETAIRLRHRSRRGKERP